MPVEERGHPLVSVVLRTYNRAHLVGRAIDSVLSQSYANFELILLDDCSEDDTPQVVNEYVRNDERIVPVRNPTRQRYSAATANTGTRAARGKYVAYLDDDDIWLPNKLKLQISRMEELGESFGLITCAVRQIDLATGKAVHVFRPRLEGSVFAEIINSYSSPIGPPSAVMIRRSVFHSIGYYSEEMPRGAGQDLYRRLAKHFKVTYVPEICIEYSLHPHRITTLASPADYEEDIRTREIKIERLQEDLDRFPKAHAQELTKLGNAYCMAGRKAEGRRALGQALRLRWRNRRAILFYLFSFLPTRFYLVISPASERMGGRLKVIVRALGR